jgi:hypothetical protein
MVATDALENFRAANRRVANVAACQASLESPDAETKRKQAATVVNAVSLLRMITARR